MEGQGSYQDAVKQNKVAVLVVPFLAQGHLNQLLHLSHLIASYGLPVHYASTSIHNRQAKLRLQGWQSGEENSGNIIQFHDFELPPYESPPPNPDLYMHFPGHLQPLWDAALQLYEPVSELMKQLSSKFSRLVVIHDSLFASVVQDVGIISNAESYSFVGCSAFTVFLGLYDSLNKNLPFELNTDDIPDCQIPSSEGIFTTEFENFIHNQQQYVGIESGWIYDTSRVIEGRYVELLEKLNSKKCFAIGPFNPIQVAKNGIDKGRHYCIEWLDKQEKDSVIYVSFGTMSSVTDEQIRELAIGLEKSGQKFIWVLRTADKSTVFSDTDVIRKPELPERYEERVKDRAIVVREWVPQLEILAHSSTGGFLSHCGWNSCMESISMGVPIAAWPMHSDQPRNSVLVAEVLKIGTMVRDWVPRRELVSASVVENAVRKLMVSEEGRGMRKRAVELGDAVRRSVSEDGSTRLEIDSFIDQITR